jgi:hypothetical protein
MGGKRAVSDKGRFRLGASRTLRRLCAERTVSSLSGNNMSENAQEAASTLREPEDTQLLVWRRNRAASNMFGPSGLGVLSHSSIPAAWAHKNA